MEKVSWFLISDSWNMILQIKALLTAWNCEKWNHMSRNKDPIKALI